MTLSLTCVASALQFPEGPVALADGSVLFTEIQRGTLSRWRPGGRVDLVAVLGGGPNGAALGPDGALYVTNNGGSFQFHELDGITIPGPTPSSHEGGSIQRVDLDTGEVRTLYTHCAGQRLIAPNDLVFDRQGGFWFTDHGCGDAGSRRFGGLYYAHTDGSHLVCACPNLLAPNGLGLSPDEQVLYVSDTYLGRLWAFDIASAGVVKAVSPFQPARVVANLPGCQFLDSLALQADGQVCVATILNGGITVFDPRHGETTHTPVPDLLVTNLCFGGLDGCDVWITASGTGKLYHGRWSAPGLRLNFTA